MELDAVDSRILAELQGDARLSMRDLAVRVGVSTPTASARVKTLEAMGLIRGYHALLDARMLGRLSHVVEVEVRPADAALVAERLGAIEGVASVTQTVGGRLFLFCHSEGPDALQATMERLAAVEGVGTFRAHLVVGERAGAAAPPRETHRVAVACHFCGGPIEGSGVRKRWPADGEREHWFCCRNCAAAFGDRLTKLSTR